MLTLRTIFGVGWSVAARLAGRIVDFVTLLFLARVLSPADFGLIALAMTLIAVAETVLEIPVIQALTRLKVIEKSHLDTAFTLGLARGVVFGAIVLIASWPFAFLYHDQRLIALIAALALGPVARGLYSPGMIHFIRELRFREVFTTQFAGKVAAAGLALASLHFGAGYWAIAVNTIAASVFATLLSYAIAPYRPALSFANLRDFAGFIGWFSSSQLVAAVNWQFDRVLLGHFVSRTQLGQYTMAGDLAVLPTQSLIGPAMQPVMAAFSKINEDQSRLRQAYLKANRFTMMLAMPASIFMAVSADLIVGILFDAKWTESAVYLQWLALTVVFNAYIQPLYSLSMSVDRPKVIFDLNAIDLGLRVVLYPIGLYFYSIMGVIAARGVVAVIMFVVTMMSAKNVVAVNVVQQMINLWQAVAACAVMAGAVLVMRGALTGAHLGGIVEMVIVSLIAGLAYLGALRAFGVQLSSLGNLRP